MVDVGELQVRRGDAVDVVAGQIAMSFAADQGSVGTAERVTGVVAGRAIR